MEHKSSDDGVFRVVHHATHTEVEYMVGDLVDVTPPPVIADNEEEMEYLNQLLAEVHSDLAKRLDALDLSSPASPMRRGASSQDCCNDLGSATQACAEMNEEMALQDDLFWEEEIRKRLLERQDEAIAREILRAEQEACEAERAARALRRGSRDGAQIKGDEQYAQELQRFERDIASGKVPPPPAGAYDGEEGGDAENAPPRECKESKDNCAGARALMAKMRQHGGEGTGEGNGEAGAILAAVREQGGTASKPLLATLLKRCYSWQQATLHEGGGGKAKEEGPSAMARLKAAVRGNRDGVRQLMARFREKQAAKRAAKFARQEACVAEKVRAAEARCAAIPYTAQDGTLVFPQAAVLTVNTASRRNKK